MILLFVVFIPTLFLLQMYIDNIAGNICSVTLRFFKVHRSLFRFLNPRYDFTSIQIPILLQKLFYNTHGYFLYVVRCCVNPIARWVEAVFDALINTNIIITWFHRFFLTRIENLFLFRRTWSLFFVFIIRRTWTFFRFVCIIVARTYYAGNLWFSLIHWSNSKWHSFVDMFCSDNFKFNSLGTERIMFLDFKYLRNMFN